MFRTKFSIRIYSRKYSLALSIARHSDLVHLKNWEMVLIRMSKYPRDKLPCNISSCSISYAYRVHTKDLFSMTRYLCPHQWNKGIASSLWRWFSQLLCYSQLWVVHLFFLSIIPLDIISAPCNTDVSLHFRKWRLHIPPVCTNCCVLNVKITVSWSGSSLRIVLIASLYSDTYEVYSKRKGKK